MSSIRFTAHTGGDLAASLGPDLAWVTEQNEDLGSDPEDLDLDIDLRSTSGQEQSIYESD